MEVRIRDMGVGNPCPFGFITPPLSWRECVITEDGMAYGGYGHTARRAWKHAWQSRRVVLGATVAMGAASSDEQDSDG